jgi:anaerobic ribonucleoside-triphosphate reductase activating protein
MFDEATGEVWLVGIPRRGDLRRLAILLAARGHSITTSEDKAAFE